MKARILFGLIHRRIRLEAGAEAHQESIAFERRRRITNSGANINVSREGGAQLNYDHRSLFLSSDRSTRVAMPKMQEAIYRDDVPIQERDNRIPGYLKSASCALVRTEVVTSGGSAETQARDKIYWSFG